MRLGYVRERRGRCTGSWENTSSSSRCNSKPFEDSGCHFRLIVIHSHRLFLNRLFNSFIGPIGHNIWWENRRSGSFEPKNGPKLLFGKITFEQAVSFFGSSLILFMHGFTRGENQ